jgi:glyoxylase-like metal-dependent hydrolase (beta-lactamase superfamily II)
MRIHTLTTGAVRVKRAFLFPSAGPRRQLDLFLPGPWSDPLPIHCWAIEHEGRLLLIDSGETAAAKNIPFARFEVTREQELPTALAAADLALEDVSEVVLTHHHGDHVDGLIHVRAPVLINEVEQRFLDSASRGSCVASCASRFPRGSPHRRSRSMADPSAPFSTAGH